MKVPEVSPFFLKEYVACIAEGFDSALAGRRRAYARMLKSVNAELRD
jgi:hypothetical protein